jgi:hypothetical protein
MSGQVAFLAMVVAAFATFGATLFSVSTLQRLAR